VVAIKDGDTIVVFDGASSTTIRLAAIDAPEKSQAFGQTAKKAMSSLCYNKIAKVNPVDTDRYGRTIADVFCDNTNAGQAMVLYGFAWVYDKYVSNHGVYYDAQNEAKSRKRGLWADTNPTPPWEYRKTTKTPYQRN
ncbi:MAG: thermonuclease family protein, partial [Formosimonas sp.]